MAGGDEISAADCEAQCWSILTTHENLTNFGKRPKGGPGYRSASGRRVGWADIGKTCGNPPSTRCTAENAAGGAEAAADHGLKARDAGKDARKAAGRSD